MIVTKAIWSNYQNSFRTLNSILKTFKLHIHITFPIFNISSVLCSKNIMRSETDKHYLGNQFSTFYKYLIFSFCSNYNFPQRKFCFFNNAYSFWLTMLFHLEYYEKVPSLQNYGIIWQLMAMICASGKNMSPQTWLFWVKRLSQLR